MSGGETFLYPRFVELAEALTRNHFISINTNLSTPNVFEFADKIDPERVLTLNAGLHILERVKRKGGVEKYIEAFHYFQQRGFNIRLEYVTYPPLLARLEKDMDYYKSRGIETFNIKIFRGTYEGKPYPASFTEEEQALINEYLADTREWEIMKSDNNFFGLPCASGQRSFAMDPSGTLRRCITLRKEYGNLFTGRYYMDDTPKPCPARRCACPYEGMRLVTRKKSSPKDLLLERIRERFYGSRFRKILAPR